jgi:hypothetical protein
MSASIVRPGSIGVDALIDDPLMQVAQTPGLGHAEAPPVPVTASATSPSRLVPAARFPRDLDG